MHTFINYNCFLISFLYIVTVSENNMGATKMRNNFGTIKLLIIQYCNSFMGSTILYNTVTKRKNINSAPKIISYFECIYFIFADCISGS